MRPWTKKFIAFSLALTIAGGMLGIPSPAHALIGFGDFTFTIDLPNPLSWEFIRDNILTPAARQLARAAVKSATDSIVEWIQGNPKQIGFVGHLGNELHKRMDFVGGGILNKITGRNLCDKNIGAFLDITLRTSPYPEEQFDCSATDIYGNLSTFYADFEKGGWEKFLKVSLEPQNNPYGAYWLAWDVIGQAQLLEKENTQNTFLANRGTLGYEEIECEAVENLADQTAEERKRERELGFVAGARPPGEILTVPKDAYPTDDGCPPGMIARNIVNKTPGGLFVDMLSKNLGKDVDFVIANADDAAFWSGLMDAAIGDILNASISRLANLTGAGGLFGGSNYREDAQRREGDLQRQSGIPSNISYLIRTQTSQLLTSANRLIADANKQLTTLFQTLFAKQQDLKRVLETLQNPSASPVLTVAPEQADLLKKEIADTKDAIQQVQNGKKVAVEKLKSILGAGGGADLNDPRIVASVMQNINRLQGEINQATLRSQNPAALESFVAGSQTADPRTNLVERLTSTAEAGESYFALIQTTRDELVKRKDTFGPIDKIAAEKTKEALDYDEGLMQALTVQLKGFRDFDLPRFPNADAAAQEAEPKITKTVDHILRTETDLASATKLVNP